MANRILVTGANGYLGKHVTKELLSKGLDVVACDINFDNLPDNVEKLNVNIFDSSNDIFSLAGHPDKLIHLAWRNGFQHNSPTHMQDLPLHIAFIDNMINSGLKSVTVMGTMHEVGYWEGAIPADAPTNPQSLYGIAKNSLRQAIEVIKNNKDIVMHWIRGYYITGDDEKSNSVLGKIILADRQGKEFFPFTSGKNLYDFITVEELASQIVATALQDKYQGIINCCSGNPVSLGERAEQFIKENNLKIKLQYGAFPDRPYDSPGVWGDATVINKIMKG